MVVHLSFALLSLSVFAPMAALTLQGAVMLSGESALSDAAIAGFLFSPKGFLVAMLVGSLLLTVQLLAYSALLIPARAALVHGGCQAAAVPGLLLPALLPILRISLRFILRLLLCTLPFAGLLGLIYFKLLGAHDINYYLAKQPPIFMWALGLAAVVMLGHLITVCRLATGWVHALPLAIFHDDGPDEAIRISKDASVGERKIVFISLVLWGLFTPLVSSLLNLPWSAIAIAAAEHLGGHLNALVLVLGLCLALSVATSWLVGFCGLSLLALQNMKLYLESGLDEGAVPPMILERRLPVGRKCALAVGLGVCCWTFFISNRWLESLQNEKPAVVIAHRGASLVAPENTLAAVRAAVEAKADWVEIDVQESADGTVMVFHDRDFKRMGGPAKQIWELGDAELAMIDIGSWMAPEFSGERTPRLSEVLELCKNRSGVLIELKYYGHQRELERRVVETVEAAGMANQVMVMSLSKDGVDKTRKLRPEWRYGLLSSVAVGNVTRLNLDFLGLNARTTSRRVIREAETRGLKIHVWTVNDKAEMAMMLGRGVDGLITDDPAAAREVLTARANASFGEKILMDLAAVLGKKPPLRQQ